MTARIPVTVLTGFLGAGKTTLLNRVLHEAHGQRIAIIENEFGEAGVDGDLIISDLDGAVIEMNNGCICCTVRSDLVRFLHELHDRHASGSRLDRVIVETTGLADPAPVAQTFFADDFVARHFALDAIITVVDCVHGDRQLNEHHEAQEQVGFADRILLSKRDLVDAGSADRLTRRLRQMNPRAPISPVNFGVAPLTEILDLGAFNLDAILEIEPGFLTEEGHEHSDDVVSLSYRSDVALDPTRFDAFLGRTLADHATDLMRYKAVLYLDGEPRRGILQGVHMIAGTEFGRPWMPGEKPGTRLVMIGRRLPVERLLADLTACESPAAAMVA